MIRGKVGSSAACSWQVCRPGANVRVVMDGKHCHIRVKGEEWLEDKVSVDNVKDDRGKDISLRDPGSGVADHNDLAVMTSHVLLALVLVVGDKVPVELWVLVLQAGFDLAAREGAEGILDVGYIRN